MNSRKILRSIETDRSQARAGHFRKAKEGHAANSRRSGAFILGRDSHGASVETRKVEYLRMLTDKWYVRMSFKREDGEKLKGAWQDVERRLKAGDVPRKHVKLDTHIITAVRTLAHVRHGYEEELARTDAVLRMLDSVNIEAARKGGSMTDKEIDDVLTVLDALDDWLSKKQVAVKKIVGRGRLARTKEMFSQAKETPKGAQISRACAVFTSLRNRLGGWRDKQVAGIAEYNWQRECALRVERDQWLHSKLVMFAAVPERVSMFQMYDENKLNVVSRIRAMIEGKTPVNRILSYIQANKDLFRVSKRQRENAEQRIALMERGHKPKDQRKVDYLIGHYGWLYRYVRESGIAKGGSKEDTAKAKLAKEKALSKLDYLELFVKANKPGFMLQELSKDPDEYLEPMLGHLNQAVEAFEADDFDSARELFAAAAGELEKVVYPRRASA